MKKEYLKRLLKKYILFGIFTALPYKLILSNNSIFMGSIFVAVTGFLGYICYRISKIYGKGFYNKYFFDNMKLLFLSMAGFALFTLLVYYERIPFFNLFILGIAASLFSLPLVKIIEIKKAKYK